MTTTLESPRASADHAHDGDPAALPGAGLSIEKMPAHWLMAQLGKRVLRPGGRELTRWMIATARVSTADDVVELAPGLGVTAQALLAERPRSYVGIERDEAAVRLARGRIDRLRHPDARVLAADASRAPLPDGSASLVVGEAMLSMQPPARKKAIVSEAARLLRPGGRYAIHELAIVGGDDALGGRIQRDLSRAIHVGVRIGSFDEWCALLEAEGLEVRASELAPMRLLEADRLVADEGVLGAARFGLNALFQPRALRRLLELRAVFRAHAAHLRGIALVAHKRG